MQVVPSASEILHSGITKDFDLQENGRVRILQVHYI